MSLFTTPEQHAANGPDTWRIVKYGRGFAIVTKDVTDEMVQRGGIPILTHCERKRDAVAILEPHVNSWLVQAYEKEGRWYAGETPPGQRSWAECKAEKEKRDAAAAKRRAQERRKVERMGVTPEKLAEWRAALAQQDEPGAWNDAAAEMLDHLTTRELYEPASLNESEAAELYRELSASWGFISSADYYLNRIKYQGLDTDKSALDVLEEMRQDEIDAELEALRA